MRETARCLLAGDAEVTSDEELQTLTLRLRGHLILAVPVVEELADRLPEHDVPRACAYASVMRARARLRLEPGRSMPQRVKHAVQLARSVDSLCDHYENLSDEQPDVLDESRAALLVWWNHCLGCRTCSALDDADANANLPCTDADQLYQAYRRASSAEAGRSTAGSRR
ncbi:DUF6415 family natural product biosynthesis protein [Streptomyces sp. NPDC001595]|uniref:DUF6415 family natural product biosynthesis protein n=1 Tax=Streptomyces sp. NPDC001532 TaxID=3154520 RepID=UPI0033319B63